MAVFIMKNGFTSCTDEVGEYDWNQLIVKFADATINQTWSFGASLSGDQNLSHVLLKHGNEIVAAAQVRLYQMPLIKRGLAYLPSGPLWEIRGQKRNMEHLRLILRALQHEYVGHRHLYLRILPRLWDQDPNADQLRAIFKDEGFKWQTSRGTTLLLNLIPSLEEIRKQFNQKWRNLLNNAERQNLTVEEGGSIDTFNDFKKLYKSMIERKNYLNPVDIHKFSFMFNRSNATIRPWVIVCYQNGIPQAGGVFSILGEAGIYFLGATNEAGMKSKASYLVQWRIINYLKQAGFKYYDLGGVSPERTPTTFHFKAGLCGKNPKLVYRLGDFYCCSSLLSYLTVSLGEWLRKKVLSIRD